jgi:putative oxidoreductase
MLPRHLLVISRTLQILVAVILFQTLFFKFTGAEESVYIFTTLGAEPWGRIGSGVAELIAVVLLLYPPTAVFGALLSTGIITGALLSHTKLGLVVNDDGGLLFALAVVVFVASVSIVVIRRAEVPLVAGRLIRTLSPS